MPQKETTRITTVNRFASPCSCNSGNKMQLSAKREYKKNDQENDQNTLHEPCLCHRWLQLLPQMYTSVCQSQQHVQHTRLERKEREKKWKCILLALVHIYFAARETKNCNFRLLQPAPWSIGCRLDGWLINNKDSSCLIESTHTARQKRQRGKRKEERRKNGKRKKNVHVECNCGVNWLQYSWMSEATVALIGCGNKRLDHSLKRGDNWWGRNTSIHTMAKWTSGWEKKNHLAWTQV